MNALCSICLEVFRGKAQDPAYSSKCGHVFHHKCIFDWQAKSKTCPDCREPFTENDIYKLNFHCEDVSEVLINDIKLKELQLELDSKNDELAEVQLQLVQKNNEVQELEENCRAIIENLEALRSENEKLKKDLERNSSNLVRNDGDSASSSTILKQKNTNASMPDLSSLI